MTDWHRRGASGATNAWTSKRTPFADYYGSIVGAAKDAAEMREGVLSQTIATIGAFLEARGVLNGGGEDVQQIARLGDRHKLQLAYADTVSTGTPAEVEAWRANLLNVCDAILKSGCVTFGAPKLLLRAEN